MIPSPKVATYDLDPHLSIETNLANNRKMSVHPVADKTVEILETGRYPFVILNLANPDMVISDCLFELNGRLDTLVFMRLLSRLVDTVTKQLVQSTRPARNSDTFYSLQLIMGKSSKWGRANLSNAEKMISEDGKSPHTAHTGRLLRGLGLIVDGPCPICYD